MRSVRPPSKVINRLTIEILKEIISNKQRKMQSNQFPLLSQPPWFLLFFLGLLSITKLSISSLNFIYTYFLRPQKNLRRYGKWAVVTGPTSGIGLSLAFELAKNGMNLILVGRSTDKLEQVKAEICGHYESIEIKTVAFDLSCDLARGIESLREAIHGLDVGLLVNNAGLGEPRMSYFHEADVEAWMKMLRVNLQAVVEITHTILPLMLKRNKSAIVNIGSGSAVLVYPLNTIYASTKAFFCCLVLQKSLC